MIRFPLSPLEGRVYHYLLDFLAENTYQPSVRDIGRHFGIKSTKSVADLLQSIAEKGYIERDATRSRGVRILGFSSAGRTQPVPLYTSMAATEPRLSEENRERFIAMDRSFVPSEDAFFLRMDGDAMIDRGILPGDLVLVNPSARARDGESVAVRVANRAVIRVLAHRGARLELTPASTSERAVLLGPEDDFEVLGVVAAVFRSMHERAKEPATGRGPSA